jgi:hypothetical protein
MVMNRIPERPPLTLRLTWGGTDPFLSLVKYIERRSRGAASRPAGVVERWMKCFNALGFTKGALNRKSRIQTARTVRLLPIGNNPSR